MNVKFVDVNGVPHNSSDACGYVCAKSDSLRHEVLISSIDGRLYDPQNYKHDLASPDRQKGGKEFTLTRCSRACYQNYVLYLRNRLDTSRLLAERRLLDAC